MNAAAPHLLFAAEGLTVCAAADAAPVLEDISLKVRAGDIVTVLGREDAGGDVLKAVLAGFDLRRSERSGTFTIGALDGGRPARIVYLPAAAETLAPHASVGGQLTRVLARRQRIPLGSAREELALALTRLTDAPTLERLKARPARVPPLPLAASVLALALAQHPDAIVAGDPAKILDPGETEALIALLLKEHARAKFALVYFTGDPSIAIRLGGRIVVLRDGKVIEEGPAAKLASGHAHPYTQSLFRAVPRIDAGAAAQPAPRSEPLLQIRSFAFEKPNKFDPAKGITFDLRRGASLALVGERGSGRRALARAVLGLAPLRQGRIIFDSVDIGLLSPTMRSRLRRRVVFVTGDDEVLDPRMNVRETVVEPLASHMNLGAAQNEKTAAAALRRVGLGDMPLTRRPDELNAVDRRRLQVARAIAATPTLVVLYEPVAGLDALGAALVLDLLREFRAREGVTYLLITANFAVAQALADDALVIKDRAIVERGAVAEIVRKPQDPYTKGLIAAVTPARPGALPPGTVAG